MHGVDRPDAGGGGGHRDAAGAAPGMGRAPVRALLPGERHGRRKVVVAAISEEVPRLAASPSSGIKGGGAGERRPAPEKVALRAALTVRRKQKEDIKEAVAGHLDALWDMVGRNVVLELISTKIHPSKKNQAKHSIFLGVSF